MKYYVYELHIRENPYHSAFASYVIYNRTKDKLAAIITKNTQREARDRCRQILDISTQYEDDMSVWRDWPIIIGKDELTEEKIIEKIKEREI
jgi:hypothetical protein